MKFLITGANGDIAISICRIIKKEFKNSVIEGTDIVIEGPGEFYFKKIYKVPPPHKKNYLNQLLKLSTKHKVIIPTTEEEIIFFSKNLQSFKGKFTIINSRNIINTFSSKFTTYEFLKKNKFGVPSFCYKLSDIKKFNRTFFLKKNFGHGNKSYKIINTYKKFKELNTYDKKKWIAQEYLGKNYSEYTSAVVKFKNYENVIILRRKLDKGYTYFAEVIENKYLKKILINLARIINLNGSINVQLKMNKHRYVIFEINPRLSSTVMMRNKMGFKDLVWWINYVAYGEKPKLIPKIKKIKMIKFVDEKFI